MDYISEIAKQGFGYLLAAAAITAYYLKDKQVKELQEKRVEEIIQINNSFTGTVRDLLNAVGNLQKSVDLLVDIIRNGKH